MGLSDGSYYFQVRAIDDHNDTSPWSNQESITVLIPNQPPTTPILNNPGTIDDDGNVTISWSPSTDADGNIDHYQLQISLSSTFATILDSFNLTTIIIQATGLAEGIYYFRVRAFDDEDTPSQWSNIESIEIQIPVITPPPTPPVIPGFPFEALLVGLALCLGISLIYRLKRHQKRVHIT